MITKTNNYFCNGILQFEETNILDCTSVGHDIQSNKFMKFRLRGLSYWLITFYVQFRCHKKDVNQTLHVIFASKINPTIFSPLYGKFKH